MKIAGSGVYLDTSALAKLYVPGPDSDALEEALIGRRDEPPTPFTSRLPS